MIHLNTHRERSIAECTRDAIFLFQVRRTNTVREPDGYYWEEGRLYEIGKDDFRDGLDANAQLALQDSGKVDPFIVDWWETEYVFLDRGEAEEWEKQNHHNYGGRGKAWRIYSVPAVGDLAKLLCAGDEIPKTADGEFVVPGMTLYTKGGRACNDFDWETVSRCWDQWYANPPKVKEVA